MTTISNVDKLLSEISERTKHSEFVIIGSLSIIGCELKYPKNMACSVDVDTFLKNDPQRHYELSCFGENSKFHLENGFYADPVSPKLVSAPDGWQTRLISVKTESNLTLWFMDILDAATSKIIRGEERDIEWVRSGIKNNLIDIEKLKQSVRKTNGLLDGEALTAINLINNSFLTNEIGDKINVPDSRLAMSEENEEHPMKM